MLPFNSLEMLQKRLFCSGRKHRVAIFIALARSDNYLIPREVNIFDSQTATLH